MIFPDAEMFLEYPDFSKASAIKMKWEKSCSSPNMYNHSFWTRMNPLKYIFFPRYSIFWWAWRPCFFLLHYRLEGLDPMQFIMLRICAGTSCSPCSFQSEQRVLRVQLDSSMNNNHCLFPILFSWWVKFFLSEEYHLCLNENFLSYIHKYMGSSHKAISKILELLIFCHTYIIYSFFAEIF